MVHQHDKRAYKLYSALKANQDNLLKNRTTGPKMDPLVQKTSSDRKLLKIKVNGNELMISFDF